MQLKPSIHIYHWDYTSLDAWWPLWKSGYTTCNGDGGRLWHAYSLVHCVNMLRIISSVQHTRQQHRSSCTNCRRRTDAGDVRRRRHNRSRHRLSIRVRTSTLGRNPFQKRHSFTPVAKAGDTNAATSNRTSAVDLGTTVKYVGYTSKSREVCVRCRDVLRDSS